MGSLRQGIYTVTPIILQPPAHDEQLAHQIDGGHSMDGLFGIPMCCMLSAIRCVNGTIAEASTVLQTLRGWMVEGAPLVGNVTVWSVARQKTYTVTPIILQVYDGHAVDDIFDGPVCFRLVTVRCSNGKITGANPARDLHYTAPQTLRV